MKTIIGYESPIVPPPEDYKGNFFEGKAYKKYTIHFISYNDISATKIDLFIFLNKFSK